MRISEALMGALSSIFGSASKSASVASASKSAGVGSASTSAGVGSASGSAARNAAASARRPAFDLKGVMAPLTVLRLRTADVALVERQLRIKVAQLPQFFEDAPVVLDFSVLGGGAVDFPFVELAAALRSCRVVPVAVVHLDDACRPAAAAAGLGVLRAGPAPGRGREAAGGPGPVPSAAVTATTTARAQEPQVVPAAAPPVHRPPMVVRQPVRGGQVIYAQHTDLIVLAPVNPGAQLLADGHIHVYAPLKGRAVAGVHGARDAQVFCLALEPELVGVDTGYVLSDDVPAAAWGGAARVHLGGDGMCVVSALAPGRGGAREDASGRRRAF